MNPISRTLGWLPDARWRRRQLSLAADAVDDAIHAFRMLRKTPGFTAIALLVFAIGIGAVTAIVSLADALLLRPLPLPQPGRVMTLWQYNRETDAARGDVAPGNALEWIKRARSFETIAIAEPRRLNTALPGREPEQVLGARVSDQFFKVVGTSMLHGRAFLPQEHVKGAGRVAILSHRIFTERFGGDPSIIGQAVRLDDEGAHTIVGVMPPGIELRLFDSRFQQPDPLVWLPWYPGGFEANLRVRGYWNVIGRLAPGVSVDQARAELEVISAQLSREYPQSNKHIVAELVPLRAHLAGGMRDVLPLLLGAAAILLMVACANVANLLLARGVGRGREFAVRQALGATRARLVRQMLVESLLLATVGGMAGLALARWTLDVIATLRPLEIARVDQIPIDARAAGIACAVTLLAAIVAGLAPSIQLSRPAASAALKEGRTSARRGVRSALVIAEVAAALVLAVGAGLLVRSFMLIQRVDPGFTPKNVAALQVFVFARNETPQKRIVFFQQALDGMRVLPGVVAVGAVSAMPFAEARVGTRVPVAVAGRPVAPGDEALMYTTVVAGDYFRALGVPLVKGRLFDSTDTPTSRQVVLVSRSAAQQIWPGSEPLGSMVQFQFTGVKYDAEVVGIVADVRHDGLDRPTRAELFLSHSQSGLGMMTVVARTAPGSPTTLQMLKEQIWVLDPLQPFYSTATVDQLISRTLVGRRFNLFLLGGFALMTLLLTSAGVYGVMSFTTTQRTREFGVLIALGAARRDIMRLVLRDGLKLAALGVVVGTMVALPLTRVLRSLLFGVTATDPVTFISAGLALVLVAAAACYVPATRALKVDPVEALRVE
jgi:putative ABC transport system permease protein